MKIEIDDKLYEVIVTHKAYKKNITIRVKEDMKIYASCNIITSDREVLRIINKNLPSIKRMINKMTKKVTKDKEEEEFFYYLGKKYDIVYLNNKDLILGNDKVFMNQNYDIDKWYSKEAKRVFQEELDRLYSSFKYEIPYPSLTIRKMKTRWGVCNYRTKRVTLNYSLIKKDIKYLDYVIIHELSHLIYHDHSKNFWRVVEDNLPNYKEIRKDLKNNE
ncbi:MAG: M48 family metallopeptidase [Bacilli bacterium]|nr:M48 family metallopeptidase [Bacilli bacterium]